MNKSISKIIIFMYLNTRVIKEFEILTSEIQRYLNWLIECLDAIERQFHNITLDSLIEWKILETSLKTADALRRLEKLKKLVLKCELPIAEDIKTLLEDIPFIGSGKLMRRNCKTCKRTSWNLNENITWNSWFRKIYNNYIK